MARIRYKSKPGIFEQAFKAITDDIATAAQDTIVEVGNFAKNESRNDIVAAGLGPKFANALRLNIYPKVGPSINATAQIFHKIPYAGVFEEGAQIRGKPLMWIPFNDVPQKLGSKKAMTPKNFEARVGPLQFVRRAGKPPLLVAKMKVSRGKTSDKITLAKLRAASSTTTEKVRSVPIFVGVSSVNIRKRLNIVAIVKRARDMMPAIFASKIKG